MHRKNVVAEEVTWLGYGLMRQDHRTAHMSCRKPRTCVTQWSWKQNETRNQRKACEHSVLLHLPVSPGSREDFLPLLCRMKSSAVEESREK